MRPDKSLWILCLMISLTLSSNLPAQDKRYFNLHQVTHINGGWIAFSNGELYQCQFPEHEGQGAPHCTLASGLPSNMQTVSALWAEGGQAWVAYTDGQVYGCQYQPKRDKSGPICMPATGLP